MVGSGWSLFLACSGGGAFEHEVVATFVGWSCLIASVGLFVNALRMSLIARDGWWAPILVGLLTAMQPAVYSNAYMGDCGSSMFDYSIAFVTVGFVAWAIRYTRFSSDQARKAQTFRTPDAP